jgi:uncharacterized membrane protein
MIRLTFIALAALFGALAAINAWKFGGELSHAKILLTYFVMPVLVAGGFGYCTRLPADWQRNVLAMTAALAIGVFIYWHLLDRVTHWV